MIEKIISVTVLVFMGCVMFYYIIMGIDQLINYIHNYLYNKKE